MIIDDLQMCTGCGGCVAVCPSKCLQLQLNKDGFYRPVLSNHQSCINCNLCEKICPQNIFVDEKEPKACYACISKDNDVLKTTSSGGLCYELAKNAIEKGKRVCACVYDYSTHVAKHVVIDKVEDLEGTKGSKYIQSDTCPAFSNLFTGDKWVVIGSPCQIAAIDHIARMMKCRNNFILVDFFCHGTPSMNLWMKYLKEHDMQSISHIGFRSKRYGWHTFSLDIHHKQFVESDYKKNNFYKLFFNHTCLNEACYVCHFKALHSCADIRVGDFWGEKYQDNKTGVSSCLVFTENGQNIISELSSKCIFEAASDNEALEKQMMCSPEKPFVRNRVLKALRGNKKLLAIQNTEVLPYRIVCKVRSVFGKL